MSKTGNAPLDKGDDVRINIEEYRVQASEKHLDILHITLDNAADAILVMKPVPNRKKAVTDLVIVFANRKAREIFSAAEKGLRGKRLLSIVPDAKENGLLDIYADVIASGKSREEEIALQIDADTYSCKQEIQRYESGIVVTFKELDAANKNGASWKEVEDFIGRLTTTLPDIVYVYDIASNRNIYSNRSILDLLGHTDASEEIKKNVYGTLAHPDDLERLGNVMQRLLSAADGELVQNEFRMRHADGEYRWMASRSAVFRRSSEGEVIQLIGVLQDITDRKQMEEAVKEKNDQLVDAQTLTQMGNWIFSTATGISHWSDQVYALFGAERVEGESTFDILDRHVFPEDLKKIKELAGNAIANASSYHSYYRITRADGEMRVINTKATAAKDKDGNVILKGICQDITEKFMADEKLRKNEALLQEAQRMAKLGSWEWDVETNEVTWTDELYRMYGYQPHEIKVTYDKYLHHIHPDDRHVVEVSIRSTLVTQFPFHNEHRILRPGGEERILSSTGRVITNDQGKVVRLLGVCLDITDRRAAEREIHRKTIDIEAEKRINKKKDEFISIASHELKTPLTSLKAYIQLIEKLNRQEIRNEQAGSFLSKAGLYVKRLEGLISDLLDVSKIESGKLQFTMEEFDLAEMLNESLENNKLTLTRHKLIVSNAAHVKVKGDKQRFDQVISNLLANAAKYSPKADTIEFTATADEHKVTIAVKDRGIGIGPEYLPRIFDRFYRAEAHAHSISGLGLGLYIASEIVKRHDGRIWAESEPGKGSTFYFTIPICK